MSGPGVGFEYPPVEVSWLKRDALLFANSIGCTPDELHFLYVGALYPIIPSSPLATHSLARSLIPTLPSFLLIPSYCVSSSATRDPYPLRSPVAYTMQLSSTTMPTSLISTPPRRPSRSLACPNLMRGEPSTASDSSSSSSPSPQPPKVRSSRFVPRSSVSTTRAAQELLSRPRPT